MPIYCQPI